MSDPNVGTPDVPVGAMYRALVGIGVLCGLVIVSVDPGTKPTTDRKKAEARGRAVCEGGPGAATGAAYRWTADGRFERLASASAAAPGETVVYAARDASGALAGVAVEAAGMGYQDTIRLLYGYPPEREGVGGRGARVTLVTHPAFDRRVDVGPQHARLIGAVRIVATRAIGLGHGVALVTVPGPAGVRSMGVEAQAGRARRGRQPLDADPGMVHVDVGDAERLLVTARHHDALDHRSGRVGVRDLDARG